MSSPQTTHRTTRWAASPSHTPTRTSSSMGSPPARSNRLCGADSNGARTLTSRPSPHAPHQANDLPQHAHVAAADRLHRLVLGLEPDVVFLLEEALHGRLVADERNDDVAVDSCLLRAHDNQVAVEDADVLHGLAAHSQQIPAVVAARELGRLDVVLDVLLGEHRLTGRDLADQWQARSHKTADAR